MVMYHFVTEWFFLAPIERVWKELIDIESWPVWWKSFKKATIRGQEEILQLGSVVDCEVKGALPFTMRFSMEVTAFQPTNLMELKSSGDLTGGGKWVLESRTSGTATTLYWDVGTTNPILNLLSRLPSVKGKMEKNHNDVMANGYQALKPKLER